MASRLETKADSGQILISHETYALIKKQIVCEKKEEINVKGIAHKIQTYQVIETKKDAKNKKNSFHEEYDGFSLAVDLSRSEKKKVVSSLKRVLVDIEKNIN